MQTQVLHPLRKLFGLRRDQAPHDVIDANIRSGVQVSGTNLWVLMFAIMIASVGLNVNSTATIIGAMLISPLMGPIIGAGYGAGISDFALIRSALRNLAIFTVISLLTSTLYFAMTPLQDAQSELLARTSPTIWDVLIAFFGGAAGMIGLTRKEKSTTIPGVAIATALMPPLCTVGYGIATWQLSFVLGAFYLFAINGVFIGLATLSVTRLLRLPQHAFADARARRRGSIIMGSVVTVTLVPSIFLAAQLVEQQVFTNEAQRFVKAVTAAQTSLIVTGQEIDAKARVISLSVIGTNTRAESEKVLKDAMQQFKLDDTKLDLHLASTGKAAAATKARTDPQRAQSQQQQLEQTLLANRAMHDELDRIRDTEAKFPQLIAEILAQDANLRDISIARLPSGRDSKTEGLLITVDSKRPIANAERRRLEGWLLVRLPDKHVTMVYARSAHALSQQQATLPGAP